MLFLHGILGTPRHFDFLIDSLPRDISVYSLLLPGHGGSCRDFSRSSMAKWKDSVLDAIDGLSEDHGGLILVGHSMGALLALWAAQRRSEKIRGIFALAMPLKIRFTARAAAASLRTAFCSPGRDTAFLRATREASSIRLSKNPLAYLGWVPRFFELFSLSRELRPALPRLGKPCLILFSGNDELVSGVSAKYAEGAECMFLPESSHYYYSDRDRQTITDAFGKFLNINK